MTQTTPETHMRFGEEVSSVDFEKLGKRLGVGHLKKRLSLQKKLTAEGPGQGHGLLRMESKLNVFSLFERSLRLIGCFAWGQRNFRAIRLVNNTLRVPRLPEAFRGYRVLHLSDLHGDLDPELIDRVIALLDGVEYDLCVNTGDYRNGLFADYSQGIHYCGLVFKHIHQPHFGILGNHDCIEMVPSLESHGLSMLLNEHTVLERDGQRLYLLGIDDPHFYRTGDIARAVQGVPGKAATLLLAHSPEAHESACQFGIGAMLSGHTHGGQVCLPGGIPIVNNGNVPNRMAAGNWTEGGIYGYTSRGTGGCAVPVRFFCPPEMTLHTLLPA